MAIAGATIKAFKLAWHNKPARAISITHEENRLQSEVEHSPYAAITALDADGVAWIRAIDAQKLRRLGYTVQPIETVWLHPAGV